MKAGIASWIDPEIRTFVDRGYDNGQWRVTHRDGDVEVSVEDYTPAAALRRAKEIIQELRALDEARQTAHPELITTCCNESDAYRSNLDEKCHCPCEECNNV